MSDIKQTGVGVGVADQFLKLIKTLPGAGKDRVKKYAVGANNYFTYPEVLAKCRTEGVSVVGRRTVRARKGWPPKEITSVKDDLALQHCLFHENENKGQLPDRPLGSRQCGHDGHQSPTMTRRTPSRNAVAGRELPPPTKTCRRNMGRAFQLQCMAGYRS